ncbi:MAG: class I SAM-dependent methyltransferase, partial [Nanoarchaeota archaeon]|nr:class I SAM-dependent methyltransferase [Nanoarchaeota archaeon]
MKIKTDWEQHLHKYRIGEFETIFGRFPKKIFDKALEVGAGDGFQASHLRVYAKQLISTDIDFKGIKKVKDKSVKYQLCDADNLNKHFRKPEFDFVFSSNLMEHLKDPHKFLLNVHKILKNDGISIHVMPNAFWKLNNIVFFHVNNGIRVLENFDGFKHIARHAVGRCYWRGRHLASSVIRREQFKGNQSRKKSSKRNEVHLKHKLQLIPHGEYPNNRTELVMFRRKRWEKEFKDAKFD